MYTYLQPKSSERPTFVRYFETTANSSCFSRGKRGNDIFHSNERSTCFTMRWELPSGNPQRA